VQPIAEKLAEAFMAMNPDLVIEIQGGGSSGAVTSAGEGTLDIGNASRDVKDSELEKFTTLKIFTIAYDGIAVVTHPDIKLSRLSVEQVRDIFAGEITNFSEVGGPDAPITVVSREEGSGTRAAFDDAVLQGRDITLTAVVMVSSEAVVEYVALTPGSIGYVSTLQLGDPAASGVRVLPVEGISPTSAAIDDGSYALSRPLYLATASEPTGEAREFAQWVLGPKGQAVVSETLNQLRTPHSAP